MIRDEIQKAIDGKLRIEINYRKSDGTPSVRTLSNVRISDEYGDDYISAFCHKRNEQRTFKISRISSVTILDKNDNHINESSMQTNNHITDRGKPEEEMPYVFNPQKRIFPLYGENYNI